LCLSVCPSVCLSLCSPAQKLKRPTEDPHASRLHNRVVCD
jgi:hypothetical protein